MDPQFFQTVSLVAIFAGFLLNEWRRGELRPPTAGREDDRLDIAILIIEHDMDLVFRFAKRITVLVQGEVLCEGTPQEIAADKRVHQVYLGEQND